MKCHFTRQKVPLIFREMSVKKNSMKNFVKAQQRLENSIFIYTNWFFLIARNIDFFLKFLWIVLIKNGRKISWKNFEEKKFANFCHFWPWTCFYWCKNEWNHCQWKTSFWLTYFSFRSVIFAVIQMGRPMSSKFSTLYWRSLTLILHFSLTSNAWGHIWSKNQLPHSGLGFKTHFWRSAWASLLEGCYCN